MRVTEKLRVMLRIRSQDDSKCDGDSEEDGRLEMAAMQIGNDDVTYIRIHGLVNYQHECVKLRGIE